MLIPIWTIKNLMIKNLHSSKNSLRALFAVFVFKIGGREHVQIDLFPDFNDKNDRDIKIVLNFA